MQTENKTCKECSKFDRCEMWNYSYDPCPEFKDKRKLIYADTVVEKISELILLDDHEKKMLECFVEKCVEVNAEEVIHAHWIPDDEYDICSHCNNQIIMNRLSPEKWCKNCGSRMDGVSDG